MPRPKRNNVLRAQLELRFICSAARRVVPLLTAILTHEALDWASGLGQAAGNLAVYERAKFKIHNEEARNGNKCPRARCF
ncbi:hypothetical protein NDU88_006866 [Pleurodeles waltl]|uniref:Uncharacterized protein n=1 Tax=Pleurodeles waltl TaxID=8319 RepID=A0AAV7NZC6_PLEWA|nr:hypothetical protein NDU88_006866 [Pleurodeles waltl]